jgi:putative ubiquitin-RnfH superfamily antitoxin RatB of RatAB toxin-antitoxin module
LLVTHPVLSELAHEPSGPNGVTGVIGALTVAVWGRAAAPDRVLDDGDRVEIVRPLKVDPKEARRLRYEVQGDRGRVRRKVGSLKP